MRVGLVSFWHLHGKDYARAATEHPDVEIAAVWDEDRDRGRAEASALGVPFLERLEELLEDDSIDGVVVCSPTVDHVDIVTACTRAGKHVFLEKVLADTLHQAEQIVESALSADVALTVSLWRSDKGYASQIARLVAEGVVGDVTSIRIRDGHPFALRTAEYPDGMLPPQFYDPVTARGGILIDLCHPLYLMALICGLPQAASSGFGFLTSRAVEDNAAVMMTYAHGAIGIAETSSTTRIAPFVIEVNGTGGSLLYSEPGIGALVHARGSSGDGASPLNDEVGSLRVFSGDGGSARWTERPIEPDHPQAFTRWVHLVQTGGRDHENNRLALQLSSLVEAAYASAATGTRTAVPQVADDYVAASV